MRVGAADDPVQHDGAREGPCIVAGLSRMCPDRFAQLGAPGAALILVFLRRGKPQELAHVFLVKAPDRSGEPGSVHTVPR